MINFSLSSIFPAHIIRDITKNSQIFLRPHISTLPMLRLFRSEQKDATFKKPLKNLLNAVMLVFIRTLSQMKSNVSVAGWQGRYINIYHWEGLSVMAVCLKDTFIGGNWKDKFQGFISSQYDNICSE